MAARIQRHPEAFSLSPGERKRPRKEDGKHLNSIRSLPCIICLRRPVEAAHIRSGSLLHGKRGVGTAEKPDDRWCLPLCPDHHHKQHAMNELAFYNICQIDPFGTALALWGSKDDPDAMDVIVRSARTRISP